MHVWIVTIGEPLPLPGHKTRLLRSGLLARELAARGHRVVWWASDFDHFAKTHIRSAASVTQVAEALQLRLLHGRAYPANVSVPRVLNHREVAADFARQAGALPAPDLVLCSLPPVELCSAAARYARRAGARLVIDVRDLWPDIFLSLLPAPLRPAGRLALAPMRAAATRALRQADGIVAVSESYLAWALALACRGRGPRDDVIPIGHQPVEVAPGEEDAAAAFLAGLGVRPDAAVVLFAGTYGRSYDLAPLLHAARGLQRDRRDVQVVLCGSGERESWWRTQADGLTNIIFAGWLDERRLAWLLRRARVGVAAYAADAPQSLPNKIFEYLAAGLPVLSSLRGEAEALLEQTQCGLSYRPHDLEDCGRSLALLLGDPERLAQMSHNAAETFATRFSTSVLHERFVRYLAQIAR